MNVTRAFTFGQNWRRFLKSYTPERQKIAKEALLAFLKKDSLKGFSFLDIGCGSGIHSAAAYLSGAERVFGFDYDKNSVVASNQLFEHFQKPTNWQIEHGSVLDSDYMKKLGTFDIVYSWGVLHHTGDLWKALDEAASRMHDQSLLYIALYAKETNLPSWEYWVEVKKRYNEAGYFEKIKMELWYIWVYLALRKISNLWGLFKRILDYKQSRGMEFMTDVRDWLGGWPTEFSSTKEVVTFLNNKKGLVAVNIHLGEGNTEYLFAKRESAEKMGYKPLPQDRLYLDHPMLEEWTWDGGNPVWIFGAGVGAEIVFNYLNEKNVPVAGFIDLEPMAGGFCGKFIYKFDIFARMEPKDSVVILSNKYLFENTGVLHKAGFNNLINGLPYVVKTYTGSR